ncbi:MAG: fimbrillin family protein [Alistipes sp.]|nr:fimbrillin family protein [Alistipes sp.]
MKRNPIIGATFLSALCLTLAGCSGDDAGETPERPTQPFVVSASLGAKATAPSSRASVEYGNTDVNKERFVWNSSDAFYLVAKDAEMKLLNYEGNNLYPFQISPSYPDKSSNTADFFNSNFPVDQSNLSLFAFTPTTKFTHSTTEDYVDYSIPFASIQNRATTDHLRGSMVMYATAAAASSDNVKLQFKHLTSMLRFTIKNANTTECQVIGVRIYSGSEVFGIQGRITFDATQRYEQQTPTIATTDQTIGLSLNIQGSSLAPGATIEGYLLTLPGKVLTDQTLTFELSTISGNNTHTYTARALNAQKIIDANAGATKFEAGKRYWFTLTLDEHLTVTLNTVTAMSGWDTETEL